MDSVFFLMEPKTHIPRVFVSMNQKSTSPFARDVDGGETVGERGDGDIGSLRSSYLINMSTHEVKSTGLKEQY